MAEGGSGGSNLPESFGDKLKFGAPVLIVGTLLAVAISFAILWVVKGNMEELVANNKKDADAKSAKLTSDLADANGVIKKQGEQLVDDGKKIQALQKEKEELKAQLVETITKLGKTGEELAATSKQLTEFVTSQSTENVTMKKDISDNSRRIQYIEEKLKKLDLIEKDVAALRGDTDQLKQEYVQLKGDLNKVREKGEVTEQEVNVLTERSRIFQLKVMAARAREAADAARSADLKTLLERLSN